MQGKISTIALAIIGFIVIAFTLSAFFLLYIDRTAVSGWALAFLLMSEIVLFAGLIGLRFVEAGHSRLFLRASASTALLLYFFATLVSVFFAGAFIERLNIFILIELAIISLSAIIIIVIFAWSKAIARRNEADVKKVGNIEPKRGGF